MSFAPTFHFVPKLWRPVLPETIDGRPLATTVSELFWWTDEHGQRARLTSTSALAVWLRPEFVLMMLLFYVFVSKPLTALVRDKVLRLQQPSTSTPSSTPSTSLRNFIAVHNAALAIFSFVVAWNSWGITVQHYLQKGFMATYCDPDGTLWNESGLGAWTLIFYISKYYEFVDTWILILKGKKASFLQVYHHTGIAFIMWAAVCSQSAWLQCVTLLNSTIHTLMYTYFFIKTLYPHLEIKAAKHLTRAQITQFFIGIFTSLGVFYMGDECDTQSSRFALACLHLYGYGLIALFVMFAKRKYKQKTT